MAVEYGYKDAQLAKKKFNEMMTKFKKPATNTTASGTSSTSTPAANPVTPEKRKSQGQAAPGAAEGTPSKRGRKRGGVKQVKEEETETNMVVTEDSEGSDVKPEPESSEATN